LSIAEIYVGATMPHVNLMVIYVCICIYGDRGSAVVKVLCYKSEGHIKNPSDRAMTVGVHSASNRNDYQEYFLGVKAAGA